MQITLGHAGRRRVRPGGLSSILVAVSGDSSDEAALKLACELVQPPKRPMYIVYVIEVGRGLPVDAEIAPATAKGEEVLKAMETVAKSYRIEPAAELLQSRRSGLAIVQEAVDKQVDAIVIGVPYRELYGNFTLGDTAQYVLKHAPCRVIMWRAPMEATVAPTESN